MADLSKLYWLNLTKHGTFGPPVGNFSTAQDVDTIFDHLRRNRIGHLTLYFHGGRVDEASGMGNAIAMRRFFEKEAGTHPVFFLWESGDIQALLNNLDELQAEPWFRWLLERVRERVEARQAGTRSLDGEEATGEAIPPVSPAEEALFEAELASDPQFEAAAADFETSDAFRTLPPDPETDGTRGLESILTSPVALVRTAGTALVRIVQRMRRSTDHGIHCTVVEELLRAIGVGFLGGFIWGEMKEDAEKAFEPNDANRPEAEWHGGTYFLEKLRDHVSDPDNEPLKVSLVGHSAGSIYISQMVKAAARLMPPPFRFCQIIFLAPGVDFDLFHEAIVAHPERYEAFRMFTMRDDLESQDTLLPQVPHLYPRSLLYLVSGLLEGDEPKPIVGLERFFTDPPRNEGQSVRATRDFMRGKGRVVWSETGEGSEPGFGSKARGHGGFALEKETIASVVHLLKG